MTKEEVESGVFISVELSKLIDEIIISPQSPKWFGKMIEDLCRKYELDKPITFSKLAVRLV